MKTPREILLQRHRPADARLDAIRETAMAAVVDRRESATTQHFLVTAWRELVSQ